MSRVIIKNLPIYLTDEKLREHFGKKGEVTDCKIPKNHEGKSRRFGFVGFKTDQQAEDAVKYFNGSFIDTAKLEVQVARSLGDRNLQTQAEKREYQKRRRDEREEKAAAAKKQKVEEPNAKDRKMKEFMDVFGNRQTAKSWANDDEDGAQLVEDNAPKAPLVDEKQSDDEYDQDEPMEDKPEKEEEQEEEQMMPLSEVKGDGLADDTTVSDLDWLKQRRTRMVDGEKMDQEKENKKETPDDFVHPSRRAKEPSPVQEPEQTEQDKQAAQVAESRRLFLRNLNYTTTEAEIKGLFKTYGGIEEVHIPMDPKKNKSKGFAYVMFNDGQNAVSAMGELDGTTFQGRLLHILPGKPKREAKIDEFDMKNLPLKKQQELKKRQNAMKDEFSWNSLYMNSDMVMNAISTRLGVSKADLLNPTNSDAAVRQSLAEASVLNSVRDYFESKGVDLQAFKTQERSEAVVLVKNFPYDTKAEEIKDLFAQCGDITKVLMPPDGGIAIVVFRTVPQGRAAFKRFAYKQFRSSILKLEKGPKELFEDKSFVPEEGEGEAKVEEVKEAKASAKELLEEDKTEEATHVVDRTSVFVKNLNFKTTSEELSRTFRALQGFLVAQVKTKPHKKDPSIILSEGYGFVEFRTKHDAEVATTAMDGYLLEGHKLQCKISNRGREDEDGNGEQKLVKSKGRTKIHIKNIPFETTKKDIRDLFGRFGQLHTVRVPKKMDRTSRGFAFAEFKTSAEAENAMKALRDVHLLGRHLVLQWADADAEDAEEEIARMEAKVKSQVDKEKYSGLRLTGKRTIDMEENEDM